MTEQYSYHAINSFLILGCLIYLFYILVKMIIDCMYIKMFKKNRKERVKNLMFKLHKLEKQD